MFSKTKFFTRFFMVLLGLTFAASHSLACVSLTRKERKFEVIGAVDGGYKIRIVGQEFDRNSGQPIPGSSFTNEFIEDDFFLLSHMVADEIRKADSPNLDRRGALLAVMEGYGKYVSETLVPMTRRGQQQYGPVEVTDREIAAVENGAAYIQRLSAKLKAKGTSISASELKEIAQQYKDALASVKSALWAAGEINHRYNSSNGGEIVSLSTYSPPKMRSTSGCSSGLEVVAGGLDRINAVAAAPADPLTGLKFGGQDN